MYFPPKESDLRAWTLNFHTKCTATPATYGITAGNATTIASACTPWESAYDTLTAARAAGTVTPQMVVNKDVAKATMQVIVRGWAQSIRNDPTVTDPNKLDLGLTLVSAPTAIPAPSTVPVLNLDGPTPLTIRLRYADSASPTRRARAAGTIGQEVRVALGVVPAEIADYPYKRFVTRQPMDFVFDSSDKGKIATFVSRWQNAKGEVGPWSSPTTLAVP